MILWQRQASHHWLAKNEEFLDQFGPENVAVIALAGRARSIVHVFCARRSSADQLVRKFGGHAKNLPHNWLALNQPKSHAPLRIGRRLEIVGEPVTAHESGGRRLLVIPAAGAFGTGEHATTAMSLRLLEETTRTLPRGWRLLDAGTGTGILAIAARFLGAGEVTGFDNDPQAVAHARHNRRLNCVSRVRFKRADVLRWEPDGSYDFITANLFSELLIAALPVFRRALRASGCLIISGILRDQAGDVERALLRRRFEVRMKRRRGKWIALLCRPPRRGAHSRLDQAENARCPRGKAS